jgi:hypothetical protein
MTDHQHTRAAMDRLAAVYATLAPRTTRCDGGELKC